MGKKKPETAAEMLESLNDFLLGNEPDFKSMTEKEVAAYLKNLDSEGVFKAVHREISVTIESRKKEEET